MKFAVTPDINGIVGEEMVVNANREVVVASGALGVSVVQLSVKIILQLLLQSPHFLELSGLGGRT